MALVAGDIAVAGVDIQRADRLEFCHAAADHVHADGVVRAGIVTREHLLPGVFHRVGGDLPVVGTGVSAPERGFVQVKALGRAVAVDHRADAAVASGQCLVEGLPVIPRVVTDLRACRRIIMQHEVRVCCCRRDCSRHGGHGQRKRRGHHSRTEAGCRLFEIHFHRSTPLNESVSIFLVRFCLYCLKLYSTIAIITYYCTYINERFEYL